MKIHTILHAHGAGPFAEDPRFVLSDPIGRQNIDVEV